MKPHHILLAACLFLTQVVSGQSWQDYKANGGYSFSEVKAAVHRVTSSHVYLSFDEKAFSSSGDLTSVAILQTLSDAELSDAQVLKDVLVILRAAFSCPRRCVSTVAERQPRVTFLLLDHLHGKTNGQVQLSVDETKRLIAQRTNVAD